MTAYGSLFERLGGLPGERSSDREASVRDSVAAHLSKMLSTRAGSVLALPDYGMPDLNNMNLSLHDALSVARSEIQRFIAAYEPRLTEVSVEAIPNVDKPLQLAFVIEGSLHVEGFTSKVRMAAQLQGSGKVSIK
jgi:type VI secretion system protein